MQRTGRQGGFDSFLDRALTSCSLKLSGHARGRLESRGISLSGDDLARIAEAVGAAEEKGARESLILFGDLAAIVSIKSKTVVTVLDARKTQPRVFTNIDSAVVIGR